MKYFLYTLLLSSVLFGQITKVRLEQLSPIPQEQQGWCPGPVIEKVNDLQIVIGKNWTIDSPCQIRFNITPPNTLDPISVYQLTQPILVNLSVTQNSDEIYVYATQPVFSNPIQYPKVILALNQPHIIDCGTCNKLATLTQPRIFPPGTVPIGYVQILNGKFTLPTTIIDREQIHLAGNFPASLRFGDGFFLLTIDPIQQAALNRSQALDRVEEVRLQSIEKWYKDLPPQAQYVKNLERKIDNYQKALNYVTADYQKLSQSSFPTEEERQRVKMELENLSSEMHLQFQNVSDNVMMAGERAYQDVYTQLMAKSETNRLTEKPKSWEESCENGRWYIDASYKYECVDANWVRYRLDNQFGSMLQLAKKD